MRLPSALSERTGLPWVAPPSRQNAIPRSAVPGPNHRAKALMRRERRRATVGIREECKQTHNDRLLKASRRRFLHAERAPVDIEQTLLLRDVGWLLLADADELPQHLHVVTGGFGLGVNVLDVACQRLPFFLKPLDPIDQGPQ